MHRHLINFGIPAGLVVAYAALWLFGGLEAAVLRALWAFPVIGVAGGAIANSTGVGGGVVFIPAFNMADAAGVVDLSMGRIVAVSLLIQCFGMSVGSVRWLKRLDAGVGERVSGLPPGDFWRIIVIGLAACLPTFWLTQALSGLSGAVTLVLFKGFSLVLGVTLLVTTWTINRDLPERTSLARFDIKVLILLSGAGGVATALFSVGVGELIALWLFIRHYPMRACIAPAVIVSAVTVIAGAPWALSQAAPLEIVALAAPGAMLGGWLARPLAEALGPRRLKTAAALWISGSSLVLIALRLTGGG